MLRHSSRNLPLKLSSAPFCQGPHPELRIDQRSLDSLVGDPLQQRPQDELRAVVGAQVERGPAFADQPRQHLDDTARADGAVDLDRQALPGPLVGDGQALQLLAVWRTSRTLSRTTG